MFLYVPMVLLVLFAVNDSERSGLPFEGFTLRWFASVFDNPLLVDSLWTSLPSRPWRSSVSVVLGTLAAVQLSRTSRPARVREPGGHLDAPVPAAGRAGPRDHHRPQRARTSRRGLWTIMLAHMILTLPVVTLLVLVRLEGLDRNQELAALDLGARPWVAFLRISRAPGAAGDRGRRR